MIKGEPARLRKGYLRGATSPLSST